MPFLMPSLDGEKFFAEAVIARFGVCLFPLEAGQSISPLGLEAACGLAVGFKLSAKLPSDADMKWRMAWIVIRNLRSFPR